MSDTRWQGQYAWPEGFRGWNIGPEVYADSADPEAARKQAVEAFRGLFEQAERDPTFKLGALGGAGAFDPARVSVVDIGLPLWKPVDFKVAPFPKPDLTPFYEANFDILGRKP